MDTQKSVTLKNNSNSNLAICKFSDASIRTVEQSLTRRTKTLARLRNELGEEKLHGLLKLTLMQVQRYVGVKNQMDEDVLDATVSEIMTEWPWLMTGDLQVLFKRVLRGEYGELFERLSMPKVMTWFRKYDEERVKTAMSINDEAAQRDKERWRGVGQLRLTLAGTEAAMTAGTNKDTKR